MSQLYAPATGITARGSPLYTEHNRRTTSANSDLPSQSRSNPRSHAASGDLWLITLRHPYVSGNTSERYIRPGEQSRSPGRLSRSGLPLGLYSGLHKRCSLSAAAPSERESRVTARRKDEDVSEVEDNIVEYNDTAPVSESEDDMNDSVADNDNINNTSVIEYVAKSGRHYLPQPLQGRRCSTQNIIRERPGLRPEGNVTSILASFTKFFISDIIRIIVQYTNKEAQRIGIKRGQQEGDKFAPLREVFGLMNETFIQYYCPGESVVIDEMSLFRGRCPFKVFMKEKPDKYGALIRILADCRERYVLRMEVYAGKTEDSTPVSRGPKPIVKRLATPLKESGRNITTDRYYTSVEPAEELYTDYVLHLLYKVQDRAKNVSGLKTNVVSAMEKILSIKIKPPIADTGDNTAQGTSSVIGKRDATSAGKYQAKKREK
ncbi:hypothetical protein ANN_28111 [Periplaneta americana]|uniref:PiggyBac transposable element-derived protein domain-containing protein n=1 Tax=Periplaneta americana TaxID=6978 RepID=A0ABQ8RV03_PERAM|nr:hypothetical protein ANN_28111 [Periplaneta americana]